MERGFNVTACVAVAYLYNRSLATNVIGLRTDYLVDVDPPAFFDPPIYTWRIYYRRECQGVFI